VAAWVVVGHPLPIPGLDVVQQRFRAEALARADADRAVQFLRNLAAETRTALDAAHDRAEAFSSRERHARAELDEAREALHLRDAQYAETVRSLLDRLDELEPARSERDAAHRHAIAAETRCRALELRIEHVVMEFPRRLARKVRARLARRPTQ
jgi:outer membrane protein TolC